MKKQLLGMNKELWIRLADFPETSSIWTRILYKHDILIEKKKTSNIKGQTKNFWSAWAFSSRSLPFDQEYCRKLRFWQKIGKVWL